MRAATCENINVRQQWHEPDVLADRYRVFAAESAAAQQETMAFFGNLSGVHCSLARQTDVRLTKAWTAGYTLH